jgi:hypothetical protein
MYRTISQSTQVPSRPYFLRDHLLALTYSGTLITWYSDGRSFNAVDYAKGTFDTTKEGLYIQSSTRYAELGTSFEPFKSIC